MNCRYLRQYNCSNIQLINKCLLWSIYICFKIFYSNKVFISISRIVYYLSLNRLHFSNIIYSNTIHRIGCIFYSPNCPQTLFGNVPGVTHTLPFAAENVVGFGCVSCNNWSFRVFGVTQSSPSNPPVSPEFGFKHQ